MTKVKKLIQNYFDANEFNQAERDSIRELALSEGYETGTPTKDLPNLKKDRIVLQLVNRTNQDQEINLFEIPQGINPDQDLSFGELFETVYSQVTIPNTEFTVNQPYLINWVDQDGTPQVGLTAAVMTPAALVTELISVTSDNWSFTTSGTDYIFFKIPIDTWLYWNPPPLSSTPPAGSQPASFYTLNSYTTIASPFNIYSFTNNNVVGGTGISVTETIGNLSYSEITQEIRNNITPYLIKTMTVYADNIQQANTPMPKIIRGASGYTSKHIKNPVVMYQNKFVVTEEVNFIATSLSKLQYTVKANESVNIILTYSKGNLNAIAQTINAYIEDGIPFNTSLNQMEIQVSKKEKEYLESTLRKIWEQKKKELEADGINLDVDSIFESQEAIDRRKQELMGDKMRLIKKHIAEKNYKTIKDQRLSETNIKNIVANYAAKGAANKLNDPYNYMNGELD